MKRVAERIGIPEKEFVAYVADAKGVDDSILMAVVATELRKELIRRIKESILDPEALFSKKDYERYLFGDDPLKILIASLCRDYELVDDSMILEELESLRALEGIIPCVVTTNYDLFLEKEVFRRFEVYSRVSDYYYSDSEGIGEIYKIHGTALKPATLVVTEQDYDNFNKISKIVTSKILSVLCDYPMVIMGYSMKDANVAGIIHDLMSSLDDEKLREVENNIVYVEYDETEMGIIRKSRIFPYGEKTIAITAISTGNFKRIFDEIADMTPSMSPLEIRKARQMVKEIVLSADGGGDVVLLGFDSLNQIPADKIVIAFADKDSMKKLSGGLNFYTSDQMVNDILNDCERHSPTDVINYFNASPNRMTQDEYWPIFHFTRRAGMGKSDFSPKLVNFFEYKRNQFEKKLLHIGNRNLIKTANVSNLKDLETLLFENPGKFYRSDVIFYYYSTGLINEGEAKSLLKQYLSKRSIPSGEKSAIRCAVTYLSFKKYLEEE